MINHKTVFWVVIFFAIVFFVLLVTNGTGVGKDFLQLVKDLHKR